jgi:hypothetical protein
MTPAERAALKLTADLWSALSALPVEHPCDLAEHCRDIHSIQNRIMAREAARLAGWSRRTDADALDLSGKVYVDQWSFKFEEA